MTRAGITPATAAEVEADGTRPGYLVEIQFPSGTLRHCSRGQVTWGGFVWIPSSVKVTGIEGGGQRGTLGYFDPDASLRTLILLDGVNDRRVLVRKFYAGALASGDPVLLFDGVGDGANIKSGRISIGLVRTASQTLMTPRLRIGPGTGFNHLTPEGTVIQWAGRTIRLERRRG